MLFLKKGILLPTAEIETLNPKLAFKDWNIALPQDTMGWPTKGCRQASVNSFGFGSANA